MIEGLDKLLKRIERYENVSTVQGVRKGIALVQAQARAGCISETGELRNSIHVSDEVIGKNEVVGTCFTNKSYAPYVEFGTGPKGQANHAGISPNVPVAYSQSPWWIHESQIDKGLAEKYHWFYIDTKDGRFYQCNGQPARPFMYPALKNNEEKITRLIANDIKEQLK